MEEYSPSILSQIPSKSSLPIVFLPKSLKKNLWSEIAETILRSVHSQDSFNKTSALSFKVKPIHDKPPTWLGEDLATANSPLLSEFEKISIQKSSIISPLLIKRKRRSVSKFLENKKIQENIENKSFSQIKNSDFLKEEEKEVTDNDKMMRRSSSYGNIFGIPTNVQRKANGLYEKFRSQMEKKMEANSKKINLGLFY